MDPARKENGRYRKRAELKDRELRPGLQRRAVVGDDVRSFSPSEERRGLGIALGGMEEPWRGFLRGERVAASVTESVPDGGAPVSTGSACAGRHAEDGTLAS